MVRARFSKRTSQLVSAVRARIRRDATSACTYPVPRSDKHHVAVHLGNLYRPRLAVAALLGEERRRVQPRLAHHEEQPIGGAPADVHVAGGDSRHRAPLLG
eukprot:7795606-Pyramimonas_sp.AAC.1